MTATSRLAVVAVAIAACGVLAPPTPQAMRPAPAQSTPARQQEPRPVFRSTTDLVTIPVFVKGDAGRVATLTAADFVLTDNGVRQSVELVDSQTLPVDVTVVVETSRALVDYADDVNEQVRRIASMVRPQDRLEVMGVGDYVSILLPFGPPDRTIPPGFANEGLTSINDALVAALLRDPDPDRRHLVIALTDSIDTMSGTSAETVRAVAEQSNATLVVSWITLSVDDAVRPQPGEPPKWLASHEKVARHVRAVSERTVPRRQTWTPHVAPPMPRTIYAFDAIKDAAELTGGGLYPPGIFVNRNASVIFDKVYSEFRQSVVLRYRPEGVDRVGWHDVTVTLPHHPGFEVRPRRGYLVEAVPAPETAADESTAPAAGSFEAVMAAAAADNLDGVLALVSDASGSGGLATLIDEFAERGNRWPDRPRREFALALVIAAAAAESARDDVRLAGLRLLSGYERLVRPPLGPDEYERDWLVAAAAVMQGARRPAEALPRIRAALTRFPDEPRLKLARAVLADQLVAFPETAEGLRPAPPAIAELVAYYDAVADDATATAEATIRKAWLLRRLGRDADAAAALDGLGPVASDVTPWRDLVASAPAQALMSETAWRRYWQADFRSMRDRIARLWPR